MWNQLFFLCLTITWTVAQNGRGPQHQDHSGHGWDIRLAVPGKPGNDYPTLGAIPRTTFSCAGKEPGYYADTETNCQVFRVCTLGSTYGFQSFLCPNGTLFNQAVLVCDWWMKVKCENTQDIISNNNNKFENLRLGPQLMKDIKKMLTHPMRNPYDRSLTKSNIIVMQDYKAPNGQLFPNGALLAGPERPPNNVYVPAKQLQQNIQSNSNDYTFSASTPEPQYLPASNNNLGSFQRDEEFLQKQRQSKQYTRNGRVYTKHNLPQNGNFVSNSHTGRFIQNSNLHLNNEVHSLPSQASQSSQSSPASSFSQRQTNTVQTPLTSSTPKSQRVHTKKQRSQFKDTRRIPQTNSIKLIDKGETYTETQSFQVSNTNKIKQSDTEHTALNLPKFSDEINGKVGKELKDNLVSRITDIPTTVVTKIFNRVIQETKAPKPKSHITFKTWLIKPSKSGRQLNEPIPFTNIKQSFYSPTPSERLVDHVTPYIYEMPKSSQSANVISTELNTVEPYIYTKPTFTAKQIQNTELETIQEHTNPTTNPTRPTVLASFNLEAVSIQPTKPSQYYLSPVTFRSTERLYLPPSQDTKNLPRLYLSPDAIQKPVYYQSAQLRASTNVPSPTKPVVKNLNLTSFSSFKMSHNNAFHNNLTFADILTKEKLDITVNDIVKDTNNVLKTASPPHYDHYGNSFQLDPHQENYISTRTTTDSDETVTSQPPLQFPSMFSKSSKLIATPARNLIPPEESYIFQNTNPLSKLPFYKEPGFLNTIERTVSIKITIPEQIAMYLFKNQSDSDFDKLEVLNTGSSNYLVLSNNNNNLSTQKKVNFIPIAKLYDNNNLRNISDSQALVYSFFTDSINLGREYRNLAQQEVVPFTATPTPAQFQNLNNQQISDITNKISNLTSSQFSSNHFYNINSNTKSISAHSNHINQPIQFTGSSKNYNEHRARQIQTPHFNHNPSQPAQRANSGQFKMTNIQQNVLNNSQNIYSGQLYRWPVPEVTNQIYNRPISENLINSNTLKHETTQMLTLQRNSDQNNAVDYLKESSPDVEIIKAETINLSPDKRLEPSNESEQVTSTETLSNLLNSGKGISAHLQDKIVGTIPHPLEENKLVTYRNDRSYYLYTKFDENTVDENVPMDTQINSITPQNSFSSVDSNTPDESTFQLIPSVNYELEDEQEQQQILDAFQIDEFGAPRDIIKPISTTENSNVKIMTSNVDISVEHPTTSRWSDKFKVDPLYSGPSSYTAPQSSIGRLEKEQSNLNSRLENFDSNNESGYPKERPARQFVY